MDIQSLLQPDASSIAAPFPMATVFVTDFAILMIAVVVVIAVALFWALWRRNALAGVAMAVAFGVALIVGVIFQVRNAEVATVRREHARNQLQALEREIRELELRQKEEAQRRATQEEVDPLPEDGAAEQPAPEVVTTHDVSAAWLPEVDEQFDADVYPSAELAARALIRNWVGHFEKLMTRGAAQPTHVRLTCRDRAVGIDELALLEAMDEQVRTRFPNARVLLTTESESKKPAELMANEVSIELSVIQSRGTRSEDDRRGKFEFSGVMSATFAGRDWNLARITRFIEKPWLTATSEFLSLRHGTSYLVVRSNQLAASHSEASRDVLGVGANQLGHLIDPREDQGLPRAASLMMLEQLEAGKYIADRFVQRLRRPYGDVYREALLIDIGNANLQDMIQVTVNEVRQHATASQRRTATRVSGIVGIIVVLGSLTALYLLVNWLTRGYYRGPLAVVVCVVGSSAIVGVLMVIGMLA